MIDKIQFILYVILAIALAFFIYVIIRLITDIIKDKNKLRVKNEC
jgi:hypothetical protein